MGVGFRLISDFLFSSEEAQAAAPTEEDWYLRPTAVSSVWDQSREKYRLQASLWPRRLAHLSQLQRRHSQDQMVDRTWKARLQVLLSYLLGRPPWNSGALQVLGRARLLWNDHQRKRKDQRSPAWHHLPYQEYTAVLTSEALQTKDPEIMCKTLRVLQKLVLEHIEIGEDLVPYYRQLLPTLNLFVNKNSKR